MRKYEIEEVIDSMATISDIIYRRFHCMECNQCEPCGPAFMKALNVLREAGQVQTEVGRTGTAAVQGE